MGTVNHCAVGEIGLGLTPITSFDSLDSCLFQRFVSSIRWPTYFFLAKKLF